MPSLASDRSAYISGHALSVEGGFSRMMVSLLPRGEYCPPEAHLAPPPRGAASGPAKPVLRRPLGLARACSHRLTLPCVEH